MEQLRKTLLNLTVTLKPTRLIRVFVLPYQVGATVYFKGNVSSLPCPFPLQTVCQRLIQPTGYYSFQLMMNENNYGTPCAGEEIINLLAKNQHGDGNCCPKSKPQ